MIIYGRNPVMEALRGRRRHAVTHIWATSGAAREPWLADRRELLISAAEEIEGRCGSPSHQGVCAEAGGFPYVADAEILSAASAAERARPIVVALDQVQDPQNLGSICRTSECVGVAGLVIPEHRSAHVTPAVCKASAGAVEHLAIAKIRNLADFLAQAKDAGYWCYGASTAPGSVPVWERDYDSPIVLVLGSEGQGLRPRVAGACDELISLPTRGAIDSLGVAAAAAALLYGISRIGARAAGT